MLPGKVITTLLPPKNYIYSKWDSIQWIKVSDGFGKSPSIKLILKLKKNILNMQ